MEYSGVKVVHSVGLAFQLFLFLVSFVVRATERSEGEGRGRIRKIKGLS